MRWAGTVVGVAVAVIAGFWVGARLGSRPNPRVLFDRARQARESADAAYQAGELEAVERLGHEALESLDRLLRYWPGDRRYKRERAMVRHLRALRHVRLGETNRADFEFKRAIDDWSTLVAADQDNVDNRRRMGECLLVQGAVYQDVGRWDESEQTFRRGRELCESPQARAAGDRRIDEQRVDFLNLRALLLVKLGYLNHAVECCGSAVGAQKALVKTYGERVEDRQRLVALLMTQAEGFTQVNERPKAEAILAGATDVAERLAGDHPADARLADLTASTLVKRAELIHTDKARISEACELQRRACSIERSVVEKLPAAPEYRARLAMMCSGLAGLLRDQGSLEQAEAVYRDELAHWSRLARDGPLPIRFQHGHGDVLHNLADLLRERGRSQEALPLERQAVELLAAVYRDNVFNPECRRSFSYALSTLCALELDQHDYRSAARTIADYRQVEPNGFEEALEAARFLSRCAAQCAADPSTSKIEREPLARRFQDQAIESMKAAVAAGYRDDRDLKTSAVYAPLRGRDDFERIVRELSLRAEIYGRKP
jgi:tetratricopeptide (TPR) repeat protein